MNILNNILWNKNADAQKYLIGNIVLSTMVVQVVRHKNETHVLVSVRKDSYSTRWSDCSLLIRPIVIYTEGHALLFSQVIIFEAPIFRALRIDEQEEAESVEEFFRTIRSLGILALNICQRHRGTFSCQRGIYPEKCPWISWMYID